MIKKEIESNYKLALSMKDLANSDLGQQAIEDKINLLQDEYIEDHESLMFATDDLKNTIEKQSTALADSFAENVAYQDAFKYKENDGVKEVTYKEFQNDTIFEFFSNFVNKKMKNEQN